MGQHAMSYQLVATRGLHGVDAHVGAADADGALGGHRPRWVVLGHHQPMPRVHRHRARRAEVHVCGSQMIVKRWDVRCKTLMRDEAWLMLPSLRAKLRFAQGMQDETGMEEHRIARAQHCAPQLTHEQDSNDAGFVISAFHMPGLGGQPRVRREDDSFAPPRPSTM